MDTRRSSFGQKLGMNREFKEEGILDPLKQVLASRMGKSRTVNGSVTAIRHDEHQGLETNQKSAKNCFYMFPLVYIIFLHDEEHVHVFSRWNAQFGNFRCTFR